MEKPTTESLHEALEKYSSMDEKLVPTNLIRLLELILRHKVDGYEASISDWDYIKSATILLPPATKSILLNLGIEVESYNGRYTFSA
jgi:hypothetical protein